MAGSTGGRNEGLRAVSKVGIVTDSVACLPRELVEQYSIHIVPVQIVLNGRTYRDGIDITPSEFYHLLRRENHLPTTSPSPPGTYLEAYRRAGESSESILCITVTSKVSAIYDSARLAKEATKELLPHLRVEVLDSRSAAGGEGFVVLAAARTAAAGGSLEQVLQSAQAVIPRVNVIATIDTLYYLAKGGRIPKAAAWASSMLNIKPLFEVANGEVGLLGRARTKPRAVARLLEIMARRVGDRLLHVNVMHANVPEEALRLKEEILSRFHCVETLVTEFTPVMGTHTGPGVIALAFYSET